TARVAAPRSRRPPRPPLAARLARALAGRAGRPLLRDRARAVHRTTRPRDGALPGRADRANPRGRRADPPERRPAARPHPALAGPTGLPRLGAVVVRTALHRPV